MGNRIKIIILGIISFLVSKSFAQIGNEWIDFSASYVKIQVVEDGFYRITPQDLNNAGINVAAIDPRSFRLFRRGKDVSISLSGEADASFNGTDFLEFLAFGNDGKDEGELSLGDTSQIHDRYSQYTDTAAYFLTWGGISGNRINTKVSLDQPIEKNTINRSEELVLTEIYTFGDERIAFIFYSELDDGEGFVSGSIASQASSCLLYTSPSPRD